MNPVHILVLQVRGNDKPFMARMDPDLSKAFMDQLEAGKWRGRWFRAVGPKIENPAELFSWMVQCDEIQLAYAQTVAVQAQAAGTRASWLPGNSGM